MNSMTISKLLAVAALAAAVFLHAPTPAEALFVGSVVKSVKKGVGKATKAVKSTANKAAEAAKAAAAHAAHAAKVAAAHAAHAAKVAAAKAAEAAKVAAAKAAEAAKLAVKTLRELGDLGLELLKKVARPALETMRKVSCDGLLEKAFDHGAINRSGASLGGAFYAGKCGQEFTKGLICSIPDLVLETGKLLTQAAEMAWKHKAVCIGGGLLVGGLSPAAAGPILLCGAGYLLADKLPKAVSCASSLASANLGGPGLLQPMMELGCNVAGGLVVDVVLALVSGGSAGPALVAKQIGKLTAKLTAKLPARLMANVAKANQLRGALEKVQTAAQGLGAMSACRAL